MILTVKQLKEILENYEDDMDVLVFVGESGKQRRITNAMEVVSYEGKNVTGVALEVER